MLEMVSGQFLTAGFLNMCFREGHTGIQEELVLKMICSLAQHLIAA